MSANPSKTLSNPAEFSCIILQQHNTKCCCILRPAVNLCVFLAASTWAIYRCCHTHTHFALVCFKRCHFMYTMFLTHKHRLRNVERSTAKRTAAFGKHSSALHTPTHTHTHSLASKHARSHCLTALCISLDSTRLDTHVYCMLCTYAIWQSNFAIEFVAPPLLY